MRDLGVLLGPAFISVQNSDPVERRCDIPAYADCDLQSAQRAQTYVYWSGGIGCEFALAN